MWLHKCGSSEKNGFFVDDLQRSTMIHFEHLRRVPKQYGWMYPLLTQTFTWPIAPRLPKCPAFVWSTWTSRALDFVKRRSPVTSGHAGSRAMRRENISSFRQYSLRMSHCNCTDNFIQLKVQMILQQSTSYCTQRMTSACQLLDN